MNTIKLKLIGNKVFAKTEKQEMEIAFYPSSSNLCAKGHEALPNARLFVPSDPLWWLNADGAWVDVDYTPAIADKL